MPSKINAQSKDELIGVAAGLVLGAATTAIAVETYKEKMELYGTNYVLSNFPKYDAFNLKLLGLGDQTKNFDPSSVSLIIYELRPFDKTTGKYLYSDFKIILWFTSFGWFNENGVDFSKLIVEVIGKDEWYDLVSKYISLASGFEISDGVIYKYETKPDNSIPNQITSKITSFKTGEEKLFYRTNDTYNLSEVDIEKNKITVRETNKTIIAFENKLNEDSYIISKHNEQFDVVYNERTLGLFIKETEELVQLKLSLINQLNSFFPR